MKSQEEKYQLLLKVIKAGKLISRGSDITWGALEPGGPEGWIQRQTRKIDYTTRLSGNEKYLSSVVCFCDIPEGDMSSHARKYSCFGLAFQKEFLIRQGATPVSYIVRQSITQESSPRPGEFDRKQSRAEFFDLAEIDFCKHVTGTYPRPTPQSALRSESPFGRLMETYLFPFMKFFDADKAEDDSENFYMEREWRMLGVATFGLRDIARVYVHPDYVSRAVTETGVGPSLVRSCRV